MNASLNMVDSMLSPFDNLSKSPRSCGSVRSPKSSRWKIWWCLCQTNIPVLCSCSYLSVWYDVLIRVFSGYDGMFWVSSRGMLRKIEDHFIFLSVIRQASNQISVRASYAVMFSDTKAGCGNDTIVEVVGTAFSIACLVSDRICLTDN